MSWLKNKRTNAPGVTGTTMSDLLEEQIGDYLCEDIDVSGVDVIHIDSDGDHICVKGRNYDE